MASPFDVFARFYDWDTQEATDLEFYRNLAARTGGPILDLACGTGRVALALARAGYEVVGLDLSLAMLERARQKAEQAGLSQRVHWLCADMRRFALGRQFPLVIIPLNSFMHLTAPPDHRLALRTIARHVQPRGLLVIPLWNPDPFLLAESDGRLVHDHTRPGPEPGWRTSRFHCQQVDLTSQILDVVYFYDEVGPQGEVRRTVAPFQMYIFFRREMTLLLEEAGFLVEEVYGSYELEEHTASSSEMIFVARRRPG